MLKKTAFAIAITLGLFSGIFVTTASNRGDSMSPAGQQSPTLLPTMTPVPSPTPTPTPKPGDEPLPSPTMPPQDR